MSSSAKAPGTANSAAPTLRLRRNRRRFCDRSRWIRFICFPGLRVGGGGWLSGVRTGGFELDSLAWIVRRRVESQQESPFTLGRHVVTMADALRNDDEVADGGDGGVGAGGHGYLAFEDVEFVVGVGVEMQAGSARDFDIVHARFRGGEKGPQPHRGAGVRAPIANHVRAVNQRRGAVALVGMARGSGLIRNRGGADQDEGEQDEAGERRPARGPERKQVHTLETLRERSAVSSANLSLSMNLGAQPSRRRVAA